MITVQPQTGAEELTLAVSQTEYEPLVVALYYDESLQSTVVVSRWKAEPEELARMLGLTVEDMESMGLPRPGAQDLYLALATFGRAPQPIMLQVGDGGLRAEALYPNYRLPG